MWRCTSRSAGFTRKLVWEVSQMLSGDFPRTRSRNSSRRRYMFIAGPSRASRRLVVDTTCPKSHPSRRSPSALRARPRSCGPVTSSSTRAINDRIIWVDCETTGLDKQRDALVEIAVLVTDADLNILGDGVDVVIKPPAESLTGMDPFVVNMHTVSGLLEELE